MISEYFGMLAGLTPLWRIENPMTSDQMGEFTQYIAIKFLLEGNDEFGKLIGLNPAPVAKFLMGCGDIHIFVGSGEAHQKPCLPLAAIFAAPDLADQVIGQIIEQLVLRLGYDVDQIGRDASDCRAAMASGAARWQGATATPEYGITAAELANQQ